MKKVFCTLFATLLLCCVIQGKASGLDRLPAQSAQGGIQLCFDEPDWEYDR